MRQGAGPNRLGLDPRYLASGDAPDPHDEQFFGFRVVRNHDDAVVLLAESEKGPPQSGPREVGEQEARCAVSGKASR